MKHLQKLSDLLNKLMICFGCLSMFIVLMSCFIQVVSRYIFNNSLSWTEELARAAFVWSTLLGFTVSTRKWTNPVIDVISGRLKGKTLLIHRIICRIGIVILCLVLVYWGIIILPAMSRSVTAAMHISNSFLYLPICICGFTNIIHSINDIAVECMQIKVEKEENT